MHVVEEDDDRRGSGQVVEHHGQALEEAGPRRLGCLRSPPHGGGAVQQPTEIVDEPAAEPGDLGRINATEVALQRLGPQSKRRCAAERVGPGGEAQTTRLVPGQNLARQARLAHAGITEEENDTELALRRQGVLSLEVLQLPFPADDDDAAGRPSP